MNILYGQKKKKSPKTSVPKRRQEKTPKPSKPKGKYEGPPTPKSQVLSPSPEKEMTDSELNKAGLVTDKEMKDAFKTLSIPQKWRLRTKHQIVNMAQENGDQIIPRYLNQPMRVRWVNYASALQTRNMGKWGFATSKQSKGLLKKIRSVFGSEVQMIPHGPFARELRVANRLCGTEMPVLKWSQDAVKMIRYAVEANLAKKLANAWKICVHSGRVTLSDMDFLLAKEVMDTSIDSTSTSMSALAAERIQREEEEAARKKEEEFQRLIEEKAAADAAAQALAASRFGSAAPPSRPV